MYVCATVFIFRQELGLSAGGKVPCGQSQLSGPAMGIVLLPAPLYELAEVLTLYVCMYVYVGPSHVHPFEKGCIS